MRRLEPKRELKDYESEGSAIRRIMNEKLVTHHDRGVDTPHYQATMAKQGKIKLRKSGDYDDHGTQTVYVKPEDAQKYIAKGYKKVPMDEESTDESLWDNIHKKRARIKAGSGEKMRKKGDKGAPTPAQMKRAQATSEEVEESINIAEDTVTLSPKLVQLLRMGLADKGELETVKRALKSGDKALNNPTLRKHLLELLNKLVDAIEDDSQIWVRLRKRLIKGEK